MCIIMVKEKGVEFPEKKVFENMWENNPHGAGIAVAINGMVHIEKGFLSKKAFIDALEQMRGYEKNIGLILHFRIATHGGINAECTHPFPITRDVSALQSLQVKTNLAVAHNGIINIPTPRDKVSDTMEYISNVLATMGDKNPEFFKNKKTLKRIEKGINGSRMAFLDANGDIYRVGKWEEEKGIYYSNWTYEDWGMYDYSNIYSSLQSKCPEKRFTLSSGYPADENGDYILEALDYPLLLDANNKLYEYDETYDMAFSYHGKVYLFEGDKLGKFDPDNCILLNYLDLNDKKTNDKKISNSTTKNKNKNKKAKGVS